MYCEMHIKDCLPNNAAERKKRISWRICWWTFEIIEIYAQMTMSFVFNSHHFQIISVESDCCNLLLCKFNPGPGLCESIACLFCLLSRFIISHNFCCKKRLLRKFPNMFCGVLFVLKLFSAKFATYYCIKAWLILNT